MIVEGSEQPEGLEDRELIGRSRLLEGHADQPPDGVGGVLPAKSEDLDLASIPAREPFQDLDRGCFPGAVGSEETETLAGCDLEIEPVDGLDRSEGLPQISTSDGHEGVSAH